MRKIIVYASLLILASTYTISASEGDQLPQSTMEGQTISSQLSSPSTDLSDTLLPPLSDHQANDMIKPQEDLSHEGIASTPQSKGFLQLLNIFKLFKTTRATQPMQPAIEGWKADFKNSSQTDPDDISHQSLTKELQGKDIMTIFAASQTTDNQTILAQPNSVNGATSPGTVHKNSQTLVAQTGTEDLSHQALAAAIQNKDKFYFIKTSGAVPILDRSFRQFLDYGAAVSFGVGKHIDENISISVSFDIIMLTGDWSIGGDRKSIEIAAESWDPMAVGEAGNPTVNAEDLPAVNLGTGSSSGKEVTIVSAESLKRIDVHTDLYLFPVTVNAIYKFHPIGKLSPYAGGGLGYCMAVRDSDSRAIKSKYFSGPEYNITMNNSQTSNGMLLNFLCGLNIPIYKKITFVAEANTTWYDLKSFDPILEISFKTPQNPSNLGGTDVTTYSYEQPKRIGVFTQEFVGNFSVGLVMPF